MNMFQKKELNSDIVSERHLLAFTAYQHIFVLARLKTVKKGNLLI